MPQSSNTNLTDQYQTSQELITELEVYLPQVAGNSKDFVSVKMNTQPEIDQAISMWA